MQTDAELMSAFRDFMARQNQGPSTFEPLKNHPLHRGVIDANYVRPAPTEFPKMMHHGSGMTKIVRDRVEQEELGVQWSETPAKRATDWRAKLNEVFTKSGFRIYTHHVAFLQSAGVQNVTNPQEAAQFLDSLDNAQQEQFFKEAEDFQSPDLKEVAEEIPVAKEAKTSKKGK